MAIENDWGWFNWLRDAFNSIVEHQAYGGLYAAQSGGAAGLTPTTTAAMATGDSSAMQDAATGGIADLPIDIAEGEVELNNPMTDSPLTTDAKTYGDLYGKNAEEMIQALIERDPDNATGWLEMLVGMKANRENTEQARLYEQDYMKNQASWLREGLEKAGINPILAYQHMTGGGSSAGSADFPSSNIFSTQIQAKGNRLTADTKTASALVAFLGVIIAAVAKAAL